MHGTATTASPLQSQASCVMCIDDSAPHSCRAHTVRHFRSVHVPVRGQTTRRSISSLFLAQLPDTERLALCSTRRPIALAPRSSRLVQNTYVVVKCLCFVARFAVVTPFRCRTVQVPKDAAQTQNRYVMVRHIAAHRVCATYLHQDVRKPGDSPMSMFLSQPICKAPM